MKSDANPIAGECDHGLAALGWCIFVYQIRYEAVIVFNDLDQGEALIGSAF